MIKFRAWDKFYECMITPAGIELENGEVAHIIEQVLGETTKSSITYYELMQSTGLKDKNGVEIFEGDVVKVNNMKGLVKFGRYTDDEYIIYGLDGWLFSEIYHGRYIDIPLTEYVLDSDFEVEVIGDKYEHPHLLEE